MRSVKLQEIFSTKVSGKIAAFNVQKIFGYKIKLHKKYRLTLMILLVGTVLGVSWILFNATRDRYYEGRDFVYQSCSHPGCSKPFKLDGDSNLIVGGVESEQDLLTQSDAYLNYYDGSTGVSSEISPEEVAALSLAPSSPEGYSFGTKGSMDFFSKPSGSQPVVYDDNQVRLLKSYNAAPKNGYPISFFDFVGWVVQ